MMFENAWRRSRRWFAPEVVQTSSMDCGPAALKCLLEGHGVAVSYGRLREACQTSVDGTSIDTIEDVAHQLGLAAEQVLVPHDFICLDDDASFPALVVVRHADHFTHFVVVWARHGDWLQIMDPAVGRRWVSRARFAEEIFRHEQSVNARDWRGWCDSVEFREPMRRRLADLGIDPRQGQSLLDEAAGDATWFAFGALDASVRLCAALVAARGLKRGAEAGRVVAALFRDTVTSTSHIFAIIPPGYWSAIPDITNTDPSREMLCVSGGVMLKTLGHHAQAALPPAKDLPDELAAALGEEDTRPLRHFWQMLKADGAFRPAPIIGAVAVQALVLITYTLLLRGLVELAQLLALPSQRLVALGALTVMALVAGLLDLALATRAIRLGRRMETRLRQALFEKLPRLKDRYFQSRPITDMADRSHNIHAVRALPPLAVQALQSLADLFLTMLAIVLIAPQSAPWAAGIVLVALAIPALAQPLLNERDLRVRNHSGALHGFYLDALLGLAPIRAHRAQGAIARQHEGLLVEWARASRGLVRWSLAASSMQMLLCTVLTGALLFDHFARQAGVSGTDLLLVFWALKLPASADAVGSVARRYPAIRNSLLRQMEPLSAHDEDHGARQIRPHAKSGPVAIRIAGGRVLAGGHEILREIDLDIAPGEHVAVVGQSGAGKSSLLGLLLGWHQLESGSLTIDGEALQGEALVRLRRNTAWVDPQVQLWNRSLLDNLTYAVDERDLTRVRGLIEASGLMGVSSRLVHGLQTPLGEGGGLLSGGEGQRVRLGRALLSDASRLALLDEPFRGLDRTQRRELLKSAREWWRETTLICVTHDIGETLDFDRVLVIADGKIAEDGNPQELLARKSRYSSLIEAEGRVTSGMWGASTWRRWRVAGGRVEEQSAQEARAA